MFAFLAFFVFSDIAKSAAILRAYSLRFFKTYRWFLLYLLAGIFQSFARLFGDRDTLGYAYWWIRTSPFVIAFSVAATAELWFLVMRRYPGVRRIYHWLVPAFLGLAAALTLLSAADFFLVDWRPTIFRILTLSVRYSASVEAVICSLLFLWTLLFPEQISKNVRRHAAILSLNYILTSLGYFAIGMRNGRNGIIGYALNLLGSGIYIAWTVLITRQGETPPPPHDFHDDEIRRAKRDFEDLAGAR